MEVPPFVPEPLTVALEALARVNKIVSDRYGEGDADELDALRAVAEIAERVANIQRAQFRCLTPEEVADMADRCAAANGRAANPRPPTMVKG
jgi:hypothetical protein